MEDFTISDILGKFEGDKSISDIHLATDEYVSYRIIGDIKEYPEFGKIAKDKMVQMLKSMLSDYIGGREKMQEDKELDFSFYSKAGVPYRVNAYYSLKKISMALRKIASTPLPLEVLMYDDIKDTIIEHVLNKKTGLFLVTGPTGSGKSTSLIAMIEWLNIHKTDHIITIEDPIEYIFEPKGCLVSQRELGADTISFAKAMKGAMRQDPDIIFVGEIRDPETADAALKLAETGHLVFSTLHTRNAADTIYRFVSLFQPEIQDNAKDRLAAGLLGIQSQFLLKTKDGKGRVGLYELLLNNTAISNDIRKNSGKQINSIIETSGTRGMISHKKYAERLIQQEKIDESAVAFLDN